MLRSLLVLSILVPGLVAALASSYWALLMYLWFALFRPQDWLWIDITSLRVSMVLGVVLMVRSVTTGILPNITNPIALRRGALALPGARPGQRVERRPRVRGSVAQVDWARLLCLGPVVRIHGHRDILARRIRGAVGRGADLHPVAAQALPGDGGIGRL